MDDGSCATLAVPGCTDSSYLEYDASANVDDGSCATLAVPGCTNSWYLEYDASANVDDGSCLTNTCGNNVTYQGYDYATVLIGEECWFAENLRSESYENGDAIPAGLSGDEWQDDSTIWGAVAVFGEMVQGGSQCFNYSPDGDACDDAWSLNEYGRLYNWYAVDDARGLCPSGWHVPTDEEWTILTDHLGGEPVAGVQMKTNYGWNNDGNGTNSSGFSGLPGGVRFNTGYGRFSETGNAGIWWSSSPTPNGSYAWSRYLNNVSEDVYRSNMHPQVGLSVRCVRDAECVGSLPACGICNGPGDIYECGCSDIPEGDCDCDGNQLDALGVCGGSCSADLDGDGICDDVDPGISVAISVCSSFTSASSEAWPVVLTATTIADGASSQEAQTLVINVTSLPAGAQYRVFKSIANGYYVAGNVQDLVLGQNTVTVPAVDFDREVEFQFSDGDVEFDFLSINGEELDGC